MPTTNLNCPNCGGAIDPRSSQCQYCKTSLAAVACPKCFAIAFAGTKFCPQCGTELPEPGVAAASNLPCPRCRKPMVSRVLDQTLLQECGRCSGIWIDPGSFRRICADREKQATIAMSKPPAAAISKLDSAAKYLPCPQCAQLMNRYNFARASGVIIDVCPPHGTWFDRDELARIIQFIQSGGMDRAREKQKMRLEDEVRELESQRRQLGAERGSLLGGSGRIGDRNVSTAIGLIGSVLRTVLR